MARAKGITPIISIIVLLLIIVALAGAAWTYISGFMGAYTTKVIDIPPGSSYFDGENVNIMLRNMGTSAINTSSCTVNNNTVTCGDIIITREGSKNDADIRPSAASISPKSSVTITDYACESGNVRYRISSPISTYSVNVNADMPCSYPTDPTSLWKFDGDANDSVGSNHGTPNGGVNLNYNDSVRGKVVSFDGVNDYVTFPQVGSFKTISLWTKIQNGALSTSGSWNSFSDYFMHYESGFIKFLQNPVNGPDLSVSGAVSLNQWTHIAVICASGNKNSLYKNGVFINRSTNNSPGDCAKLRLGTNHIGADFFNGLIDNVMIFNRALSPEEIKALYNSQKK